MEHFNTFVVVVDEIEVIQLLQDKVAGIIKNISPWVVVRYVEETLESMAIMQVFSRV